MASSRLILVIVFLVSPGCVGPAVHRPIHELVASLPTPSLSLPAGTGLDQALQRLHRIGATNIARARGVEGDDSLEAVTADGLQEVLLFRDGRLSRTLPIGCDRGTNVRSYLHLARSEGRTAVIVLSSTLRHQGVPSVMVLLDREPARRYVIAHDHFPEWFKGLVDPRIVGADLDRPGVIFVARDDSGLPWDNAVIFRCDGRQVQVTPVSMARAARCSCIYDWYTGAR